MAARKLSLGWQSSIVIACVLVFAGGAFLLSRADRLARPPNINTDFSSQAKSPAGIFHPTTAQWAALTIEPVEQHQFRLEFATEGKIAVNDDSSTPIFSPYAGRVIKLLARPGEYVKRRQPLFVIEATDTVQGLNDFIAALSATKTARSKLNLAQIVEKRANDLYAGKAVPVPIVNQIRTYWWCSPPRIGRQRMRPASSTARETGASFSKDKCVRTSL
jgi:cobalt-zinc-cadmium efflux system membrane fusion protein